MMLESAEKKKLLIVDDDGTTLRVLKGMLEHEYDVTIVNSGMNAMKAIGEAVAGLQPSAPKAAIREGKLLNGRQTADSPKAWVDSLSI